jgi:hypothetical protein
VADELAGAVMSKLVTPNELQLVADATEEREPEQLTRCFLGEAMWFWQKDRRICAEDFKHGQSKYGESS